MWNSQADCKFSLIIHLIQSKRILSVVLHKWSSVTIHFPSCHRFRRGAQFLSDTFSSTSLCPSYPLGIMGVSVHSPHQWIPLTPRDPRQATPATATQSRTPTSWIREFVTLQWHLTMLWASVGRPSRLAAASTGCILTSFTFKWVFIAPVAPLYVFNWPILIWYYSMNFSPCVSTKVHRGRQTRESKPNMAFLRCFFLF